MNRSRTRVTRGGARFRQRFESPRRKTGNARNGGGLRSPAWPKQLPDSASEEPFSAHGCEWCLARGVRTTGVFVPTRGFRM